MSESNLYLLKDYSQITVGDYFSSSSLPDNQAIAKITEVGKEHLAYNRLINQRGTLVPEGGTGVIKGVEELKNLIIIRNKESKIEILAGKNFLLALKL